MLEATLTEIEASHDPNDVLLGLALYDDDREFVEVSVRRIGTAATDPWLRGTAALAGGYLAYRYRYLSPETKIVVESIAKDPSVDSRKNDAAQDIARFAPD